MDANVSPLLPWDRLIGTEPEIPWDVLEQFARALPGHDLVLDRLLEMYEHFQREPYERLSYEVVYIPAIFVRAAPELPADIKLGLARLMVLSLAAADEADDAVMCDVLEIAIASMGPDAALTAVLDFAAKEPASCPEAYELWHLMVLAKDARDTSLRDRVIQLCLQTLEMAKSNELSVDDAEPAAWVLARMKHLPARHLIQRLYVKTQNPDFLDYLELLDGKTQKPDQDDQWNTPFEDWVQENFDFLCDWYINGDEDTPLDPDDPDDALDDEDDEEDFDDEEARDEEVMKRANALIEEFHDSKFLADAGQAREDYCFDIQSVLDYAWRYEGAEAKDLTKSVLHEVLLDVLPRKVTAPRDYFERLAPAVMLFLEFLEAKGVLGDTARMRQAVDKWRDEIVRRGMDPRNWGPAKSFAMTAMAAGVDLGNEKAMQRFMLKYNASMMERHHAGGAGGLNLGLADRLLAVDGYQGQHEQGYYDEPVVAPIVNDAAKVGRNDPCPCGSGKKFKKCCGNSARP
jgi:hypothetical protein